MYRPKSEASHKHTFIYNHQKQATVGTSFTILNYSYTPTTVHVNYRDDIVTVRVLLYTVLSLRYVLHRVFYMHAVMPKQTTVRLLRCTYVSTVVQ